MDVVGGGKEATRGQVPRRGAVYWVDLDPTRGSEIQKTRPCVVVSPDELNAHLHTVIVAPLTSGGRAYPWRVDCTIQHKAGRVALDQLRTVDRERLVGYIGALSEQTLTSVLETLTEFFAP
jgi:mRNA interferase MazF